MKKKSKIEDSALALTFLFPGDSDDAEGAAINFRESLYGYGPDDGCGYGRLVSSVDDNSLTIEVYEKQVPAVIAMAYAEGAKLVGAGPENTSPVIADDDEPMMHLIEVRELPGKRGQAGRRVGFICGDDFVSDLRDDVEIIDDPLGDVWGSREEAEEVLRTLLDEHGWTSLVDLNVVAMAPAGEDE